MTELLTIDQVAAAVQVHPRTVRRAIAAGELRAIDVTGNGTWRVDAADYEAWLEQRATAPRGRRPADIAPVLAGAVTAARPRARRRGSAGVLSVTADMGRGA